MNSPFSWTRSSLSFALSLTLLLGLICAAPSGAQVTLLADKPIAAGADVPGNLALALSVEFPTAISIANLGNYVDTTQYVGYFDPAKCYTYNYITAAPTTSYFNPTSVAATGGGGHDCSATAGQWSGNFMNWAATQTIDPFRWALTGGYRSIDVATQTILEKAWGSNQGSAAANYPYRGTSQGTGNNLSTSGSLIAKLTPFNSWSMFDLGIFANGNAMVFSGDGNSSSYQTSAGSAADLSNVATANAAPNHPYRVYVRVAVCVSATLLEPNCVQYGSNYKPEGLLQQYANKIRFSAFGYLNQGGDVREGGAMRSPMTFIGPTVPNPLTTVPVTNPKPEWDAGTGVMLRNPDTVSATGSSVIDSGVMNYLNKFGESSHTYKTFDNVSELYYAAVRYYENLGNVTEWSNNTTNAILDGFPAVINWPTATTGTNPGASILYTCQKNFILGIGDDHTWYDYDVGGSTFAGPGGRTMPSAVTADVFNASTPTVMYNQASLWTTELQNIEGISPTPTWPFDSGATYFIAGLAYGVHVNDIRPDLAGAQTISTYWMDVAEGQHLENLNPYYLATKYGGFSTPTINAAPYTVANPAYDMTSAIAQAQFDSTGANVLMGPSSNISHPLPDNYFNAGSASAMVAGLKSAFTSISSAITQQSTSFSFSLPNVSAGGTTSFGAKYDANGWTGTVSAFNLTFDINGNPSQTQIWATSTTLQTQLAGTGWQSARNIVTWSGSAGMPFELANFFSMPISTQMSSDIAALNTLGYSTVTCTVTSCPYLNYLRGDTSNEILSAVVGSLHAFRSRKLLLGDIVDASLTPVATPLQTFSDVNNPGYTAFKTTWATRQPMVYAGANDGMVHAFVGSTGLEQFAYIPSAVFQGPNGTPQVDGLAQLGNPSYVHHNYVDATPAAFDVDMNHTLGASGLPDWHTVLIGGLGKGGKSFYALDITDPANMSSENAVATKVLWEYPNAANPDTTIGYSFGIPVVVKTVKYGWVAILTSGYDNGTTPANSFGYLYIVNPKTGALLEKIQTPTASAGMTQASAFVKDFSDETADSVYVGDLQGQVWRFDLREPIPTNPYPPPTLLATVTDGGGAPQPITTAPLIEIHPVTRKRYVLFGTGKLLAVSDVLNSQNQSFYAIIDGTATSFNAVSVPITRSDLTPITTAQTINTTPNTIPAASKGWFTDLTVDATSNIGWRLILNPQAFNGIVTFATSLTTATDPCSPQGSSRVYALDYATVLTALQPAPDPANPTGPAVATAFVTYSVAAINLRFAGANGSPEIIVGFTQGDPQKVSANLTATLATRILNWREIPTVE
jgi:type IV pilus assembly protein PilY1